MPEYRSRVDRVELTTELVAALGLESYLEVGVWTGKTFFGVDCKRKIAVDPNFDFDVAAARERHTNASFYETTSDAFFAQYAAREAPFDLIFLDGLHTAEQTLRDFLNALFFLGEDGVVIIDDVRPDSYYSSLPAQTQSEALKERLGIDDRTWMGDVYKILPFIATFCQQCSFASPNEIPNSLIVWRSPRAAVPRRLIRDVADFPFEETVLKSEMYNSMPFAEIREVIAASRR